MKYIEEFKEYYSKDEELRNSVEGFSRIIKPYEEKFNKDFSEFNMEEVDEAINKHKTVSFRGIITSYIKFIQDKIKK